MAQEGTTMRRRHHRGDEKVAWLASKPWWGELSRADLDVLATAGDRVTIRAGRELFHEGDTALETAIVVDGRVEVRHGDEVVATLGPGEVVGELAVLDHARRNADVVAVVDTELLVFHSSGLERSMEASRPLREFVTEAAARHRAQPS